MRYPTPIRPVRTHLKAQSGLVLSLRLVRRGLEVLEQGLQAHNARQQVHQLAAESQQCTNITTQPDQNLHLVHGLWMRHR